MGRMGSADEIAMVTSHFKALRLRAGLSLDELAEKLGYKGASSIQRYENPNAYRGGALAIPFVRRLEEVVVGKGKPPIKPQDVYVLAGPEYQAARAAIDGDRTLLETMEDELTVPEVRVAEGGLSQTDRWRLPERVLADLKMADGAPFLIAVHSGAETLFVDRRGAAIISVGDYVIADGDIPGGYRIETYDARRLAAERREAVLVSGVLGRVAARFTIG
jgi:transcriptional regulator with XRE-family HTH domain